MVLLNASTGSCQVERHTVQDHYYSMSKTQPVQDHFLKIYMINTQISPPKQWHPGTTHPTGMPKKCTFSKQKQVNEWKAFYI